MKKKHSFILKSLEQVGLSFLEAIWMVNEQRECRFFDSLRQIG